MTKTRLRVKGGYFGLITLEGEITREQAELTLDKLNQRISKLVLIDSNGESLEVSVDYLEYMVEEPHEEDN